MSNKKLVPVTEVKAVEHKVALMLITWNELFRYIQLKFPKLDMYGADKGGDALEMVNFLRNDEEVAKLAKGIWDIKIKYQVATDVAYESIRQASNARYKDIKKLIDGKEDKK